MSFFTALVPQKTLAQFAVTDPGVTANTAVIMTNTGATAGTSAGTSVSTAASTISNATVATVSVWEKIKHNVLDPLAWAVSKRLVAGMTAQTVNWINSGFKGNPGYLTDPEQFFLNQADNGITDFISRDPALSSLCTPFVAEVKLALVKNYLSEAQPGSCSLTKIKNNFQGFMQDFSQGGWDGWFEMTQNDQNNPYGAYLQSKDRLSIKIGNSTKKYEKQIDLGNGILSYERCKPSNVLTQEMVDNFVGPVEDDGFVGPLQDDVIQSGPYKGYRIGDCIDNKMETVTPGSLINDSLKKVMGSGIDQLNLVNSFNQILGALATNLFKKVAGGMGNGGLKGAGTNNSLLDNKPLPTEKTKPLITLIGRPIINAQMGLRFDDPGAVGSDGNDGDISEYIQVSGVVDTTKEGQYTLTYNLTNSQGAIADTITRTVNVMVDASAPGAICNAVTDGRGNDEEPNYEFSPLNITFDQTDISEWKQTATITSVDVVDPKININYKVTGGWPGISIGNRVSPDTLGSAWVLIWRNQQMPNLTLKPESVDEIKKMRTNLLNQQDVINQIITRLNEAYKNKIMLMTDEKRSGTGEKLTVDSIETILKELYRGDYSTTTLNSKTVVDFKPDGLLDRARIQMNLLDINLEKFGDVEARDYFSAQSAYWGQSIDLVKDKKDEYLNMNKSSESLGIAYQNLVGFPQQTGTLTKIPDRITALLNKMNDAIYIAEQVAKGKTVRGKWKAIPFTYIKTKDPNQFDVDLLFCASPDFTPTKGDTYGFMVSTPANNNNVLNKKEKSDIKTFTWGDVTRTAPPQIPIPPRLPPSTQTEPTQEPVCTQKGTDEKNYILPILNGGTAPDQAVSMLNQQFNLGYGESAVFYPDSNTIGLPEFYAAGPTPTRPVSPQTGQPWDIVVRCRTI